MKVATAILVFTLSVPALLLADQAATSHAVHPGFAKLKSLVGSWKGKTQDGTDLHVTYRLVAADSVIEEHLSVADMVTMYHLDGDQLMLTHYCAGHNQPRMRARPFKEDDQTLRFDFFDATSLPNPSASHMHNVSFTFQDAEHITAEWTNYDGGKESGKIVMELARVK